MERKLFDNSLSRDEIDRMVRSISPGWKIHRTTEIESGHLIIYRLDVESSNGEKQCYLKATPEEKRPTVDLEARVLSVIEAQSNLPVPTILGVVDEHEELPAPFMLMSALEGRTIQESGVATLTDTELRTVAEQMGRYLAELHSLPVVDAFGFLTNDGPIAQGDRPARDFESIQVAEPFDSWREMLHWRFENALKALADTRFADIIDQAESAVASRIDELQGPFEPVLARVDQSWGNVLLDDGHIAGLIDWEFVLGAPPGYDLVSVEWTMTGRPCLFEPTISDRRDLVFDALVAGYRIAGPASVLNQSGVNRPCYELLLALRGMAHFETWFELFEFDGEPDDAAVQLREEVTRLC